LASLIDQTCEDIEIIVTDNSKDPVTIEKIKELCTVDPRIHYEWTHERSFVNFPRVGIPSLYDAAEIGISMTTGEWICTPNCDSYYPPVFAERLLRYADENNLDFVFCDFVQGRPDMNYHYFFARPEGCLIDKTCFMVKREWFPSEWPGKVELYGVADGVLVNELVAKGIRHGRLAEVLCVHN
jgi:glycosyltransferase involved in cell wall biosynthesis